MRLLLDTNVFLWILSAPTRLPAKAAEAIAAPINEVFVSVVVGWEIAIKLGLRKLTLPCLVCLVAAYAVLLNRMLILDAEASRAIRTAAQNDRQWVLTHGADDPFSG